MKSIKIFIVLAIVMLWITPNNLYSQAPQGFNYQAVVRDGSGTPIASQTVSLKITLQSPTGSEYYVESKSVASNTQGVINHIIGTGDLISGTFSTIPWNTGEVMMKVEIDPSGGTSYVQMGDPTKIQSVPYALYAENTKEVVSQSNAGDDDPIFVVKNKAGQVVFAVYQTGVRVYVEDSQIKSARGGFAVGGLTNQAKGQQEYFRVTPDSARLYVKEVPTIKGARGGFAVGGLTNQGKAITTRNLMFLGTDSARIYIDDSQGKGARGGFAVGGLTNQAKGGGSRYLQLTPNNYFIGHESGKSITTGLYNSFFGYQTGKYTTNGMKNIFIGYQAGYSTTGGIYGWEASNNVFIGPQSGYNNTEGAGNVFIGSNTGQNNTTGNLNVYIGASSGINTNSYRNVFVGNSTGVDNTSGSDNIFIGNQTGEHSTTGAYNICLGTVAGWNNGAGSNNIFIGSYSGSDLVSGTNNVFLGNYSGSNKTSGSGNIFIGNNAGSNTTGSDLLFIENSSSASPLIWGDFYNNRVVINGNSSSNINNRTFFVNGSAGGTGAWWNDSDERLKKNIVEIPNALDKVLKLRGVNFEWKDPNNAEKGIRMGFIAQEAELVIPEVVSKEGEYYSMQYAPINALLVEAIKEQQKKIDQLEEKVKEIDALKVELEVLKALLKK